MDKAPERPLVAVVGGGTLLAREVRELLANLKPAPRVQLISALADGSTLVAAEEEEPVVMTPLSAESLDGAKVAFLAGSPASSRRTLKVNPEGGPILIDLTGALEDQPNARLRAPAAEPSPAALGTSALGISKVTPIRVARVQVPPLQVVAHPAAIALTLLLTRLAQAGAIRRSIAHVFEPASERGQRGLDELRQQTVAVLSFQKLKMDVFDTQLAFGLLARYGEEAVEPLEGIEQRVERHLASLLAAWPGVPMPSLRVIQAPVFHGHSFSLWVEFENSPEIPAISKALTEGGIDVRPEEPPSNIGIAGQSGLSAGAIAVDRNNPRACWLWAVADNVRLAGENAVAAARESFMIPDGLKKRLPVWLLLPLTGLVASCGYHVGGRADLLPKSVKSIAIPPFANATTRYKLTDQMPEALKREFIGRTRYRLLSDANQADAILKGTIVTYMSYPILYDPATNRATAVQMVVTLQVSLIERTTGKVLFTRPSFEVRDQYQISEDPGQYFDESATALARASQTTAQKVVTAILENF